MRLAYPLVRSFGLGQAPVAAIYACSPPEPTGPMGPIGPIPGGQGAYAIDSQIDPYLNCMRDARGNAVCSDGQRRPPG